MRQFKGSRIMTVVGVTAVLAVLAAGCSSSEKKSASAPAASAPAAATTAAGGGNLGDVAAAPAPAANSEAVPAASASAPAAAARAPHRRRAAPGTTCRSRLLGGRQVIYTADITVQTKDIKTAVDQLTQLANGRGGVVFGEQVSLASKDPNNPGAASATVTLKVPPDTLNQGILDQIGRLGTELSRNETASDVTAQVADVNSREAAAQDSLARLRRAVPARRQCRRPRDCRERDRPARS